MELNRLIVAFIALAVALTCCARVQPARTKVEPGAAVPSQPIQTGERSVESPIQPQGPKGGTAVDRETALLRKLTVQSEANASAYVKLGNALMQKSRESMDGRLYEEAESAYERALALNPNHEAAMVGLAWVHNSEHDFDTGRKWAEKALTVNPALPDAYALLGDAAVELGAYDEAFEQYQRAVDLRPDLSSYSRAAHLLWLTGNASKARWLMRKAVASGGPHAENTAWCRAELALMSFHTGALVPAEIQAKQALEEAPGNPHVLAVMGRIKMAKKEYAAAIDLYRRAINVAPNHDALVALGDLYALTGRRDEAEEQYKRVVELHASGGPHAHGGGTHLHPYSHGNAQLARFYADHDRSLTEALEEAEAAYRTYKNVFTMDTLAWCYYKNGRYPDARKLIDNVLKFKTPDAAILFHAGMIYDKIGDRPAAKKYLYQALSLNPNFHPIYATVAADLLKHLGAK